MKKRRPSLFTLGTLFLFGIFAAAFIDEKPFVEMPPYNPLAEKLEDPEMIQGPKKEKVLRGYYLMLNTKDLLPENVGNDLSCTNCHFAAGNTTGGPNNGISLLGVSKLYPRFSKREGRTITLKERIENCFLRSLNGTIPSDETLGEMLEYLNWLSDRVSGYKDYPWLGLEEIKSNYVPELQKGETLYEARCALCHKKDGSGTKFPETDRAPPLWGPRSFNNGAGMSHLHTFASFIYLNMPFTQADLTLEQALDIALYVTSQQRPHFEALKRTE